MSKYPSIYGFLGIIISVKEQEAPGQRDALGDMSHPLSPPLCLASRVLCPGPLRSAPSAPPGSSLPLGGAGTVAAALSVLPPGPHPAFCTCLAGTRLVPVEL